MGCLLSSPTTERNDKKEDDSGQKLLRLVVVGKDVELRQISASGMVGPLESREFYLWKVWKKKLYDGAALWTIALFLCTLPFWIIPAVKGGGSFCNDYWRNQTNAHFYVGAQKRVFFSPVDLLKIEDQIRS